MHPLFFGVCVWLYFRSASLRKHGGFSWKMLAFHAWYVAEWEHHSFKAALHRWGVGTGVFLQFHHFCRDSISHPVRSAVMETAVVSFQRPRRVSVKITCGSCVLICRFSLCLFYLNYLNRENRWDVFQVAHAHPLPHPNDQWSFLINYSLTFNFFFWGLQI